jgi:DNA-directed RNA polymerase specialized sigma24 family protein
MTFPHTRLTLIQRLASGGSEEDWRGFLQDYWGPVCRFALRSGAHGLPEAEEIASQSFEVLWENRLLDRWVSNQAAKLRSLLCSVVRYALSTRNRTEARREHLRGDVLRHFEAAESSSGQDDDVFYAAWVEEIVEQAVEALAVEYCRKNQGDRVRVLYGRLCEGLTISQVADSLGIKSSTVDFYFRDARDRLAERLQELVRPRVLRYCAAEEADEEFARQWEELGRFLAAHGGLEEAVRRSYGLLPGGQIRKGVRDAVGKTLRRLTSVPRKPPITTRDD